MVDGFEIARVELSPCQQVETPKTVHLEMIMRDNSYLGMYWQVFGCNMLEPRVKGHGNRDNYPLLTMNQPSTTMMINHHQPS